MHILSGAKRRAAAALALQILFGAAPETRADDSAAAKPLPPTTLAAQTMKTVADDAPVYIRIFKQESELEIWRARPDGRYVIIKTFPICKWSGALGPKETLGDMMAPEGFYAVERDGLKPDSKYHLALNIGYPNALDRALGRSGDFIMVHGDCKSVGCFAMTDTNIEEIYGFVRDAAAAGATSAPVHVFPFRMTKTNMALHADHPARSSWAPLKEAFDDFAKSQIPPRIGVCGKRYAVNPLTALSDDASAACPQMIGKLLQPMSPKLAKRLAAARQPLTADGPKTRTAADIASWNTQRSGLGMWIDSGTSPARSTPPADKADRSRREPDADLGALKPLSAR